MFRSPHSTPNAGRQVVDGYCNTLARKEQIPALGRNFSKCKFFENQLALILVLQTADDKLNEEDPTVASWDLEDIGPACK